MYDVQLTAPFDAPSVCPHSFPLPRILSLLILPCVLLFSLEDVTPMPPTP